jgi:hypothetical protein
VTSLLDRLAGLALQTGPRLVARPRARYERRIDPRLLEELEVERVASSVAEPRRVVRHPPVTGSEVSPARPPRARPPLDGEQPEAIANPQPHDTAETGPTVPDPRAKPPVVDSQTAARPDVTPATVTRPEPSGDEIVVIVEHEWPDDEPRHRRPAASRDSAPPPAGALGSSDDTTPEVQAPAVRHELVRAPAEPSRQRPAARPSAPEPRRRGMPTPAEAEPITVTIGRIELRTVKPPSPPREARKAAAAAAPSPLRFNGPTLDEFLGGQPG